MPAPHEYTQLSGLKEVKSPAIHGLAQEVDTSLQDHDDNITLLTAQATSAATRQGGLATAGTVASVAGVNITLVEVTLTGLGTSASIDVWAWGQTSAYDSNAVASSVGAFVEISFNNGTSYTTASTVCDHYIPALEFAALEPSVWGRATPSGNIKVRLRAVQLGGSNGDIDFKNNQIMAMARAT